MPIYEYTCPHCRNVFEKWLKISENTENASCPKCGSQAQRIISNTAFVLKGGGWYVTDYGYRKGANEGPPTANDSGAPAASPATAENAAQSASSAASAATTPSQPASDTASGASA